MSVFHSYEKVERLEKEECDGLLNSSCYIFEKIDGANAQVYLDTETGEIAFGSRNRVLGIGDNLVSGDSFRGFANWVKENHDKLKQFFDRYPDFILMGEWLVKHTVKYSPDAYNKFYVFDIYDSKNQRYLGIESHKSWNYLDVIGIDFIKYDTWIYDPVKSDLMKLLELPSNYGAEYREGIVIKNYSFINKWGHTPYGKLLHENFKEVKSVKKSVEPNAIELAIQEQYVTKARVEKICNKLLNVVHKTSEDLSLILITKLEMQHIPRIINMVWYDIITEDMNDILKKFKNPTIDFKLLKRLVFERAKEYYIKILQEGALHEG